MRSIYVLLLISCLAGCCADVKHESVMPYRVENVLVDAFQRGGKRGLMKKVDMLIVEGTVTGHTKKLLQDKDPITVDYIRAVVHNR